MNVLIVGANGSTGRMIIKKLAISEEYDVHAMIRKEDQADHLLDLGADHVTVADLESDLDHAVKGMDAIIFAAGSGSKTGPDKTEAVDKNGARKLMTASRKADVHHFIMLSSMGADHPLGDLKNYLEAKAEADQYLMDCGLTYTIVRPGALTNDSGTGRIKMEKKIMDRGDGTISREDVAEVLAKSLKVENAKNKIFEILTGDTAIEDALKQV